MEKHIVALVPRTYFYSVLILVAITAFLLGILYHDDLVSPTQVILTQKISTSVPESVITGQAFPLSDMQILNVTYIKAKSTNETRGYNVEVKNISNAYTAKNIIFDVTFAKVSAPQSIIDTGTGYEIASDYTKVLAPGQTRTYTILVSTSLGITDNILENFTLRSAIAI